MRASVEKLDLRRGRGLAQFVGQAVKFPQAQDMLVRKVVGDKPPVLQHSLPVQERPGLNLLFQANTA